MGRELKRVPMDFDYPLHRVWYGYYINYICTCHSVEQRNKCEQCNEFARIKGIEMQNYGCPNYDDYFKEIREKINELCEPPKGEGYQLWETTSEGGPVSPVFETLDELCKWCEENYTTFGSNKASKEEWKRMLLDDFVYHKEGNVIFM